jgi:hypothetical protein
VDFGANVLARGERSVRCGQIAIARSVGFGGLRALKKDKTEINARSKGLALKPSSKAFFKEIRR